jgi:hypothetical protein
VVVGKSIQMWGLTCPYVVLIPLKIKI